MIDDDVPRWSNPGHDPVVELMWDYAALLEEHGAEFNASGMSVLPNWLAARICRFRIAIVKTYRLGGGE